MKNIIYSLCLISLIGINSCINEKYVSGKSYSLSDMVQPIPLDYIQKDSAWNIWCGSMVKGYDGKFHLFYSRWPREVGHEAWISHSQIAYAVADSAKGPYRFVNIPLPQLNDSAWDGTMTHNPYILKHNNNYYLYYIGVKGSILDNHTRCIPYSEDWWNRRNTQRIGVAIADNPRGPWKRLDTPILSISEDSTAFDALCVTNPAICIGRDNKIVMLYKAVCKNEKLQGGKVRFSVAFADSPTGPFVKSNKLIFEPENPEDRMVAEDPYIWFDKNNDMYYAIVRDVVSQFTGEDSGGLALLQSKDAVKWEPAPNPNVLPAMLEWEDGSFYDAKANHVERPFVYFEEEGVPAFLFGSFSIHTDKIFREHSFNGRIPLK